MTERDEQGGDGEIGVCHVCYQQFDTQEELLAHLKEDHDGEILPSP